MPGSINGNEEQAQRVARLIADAFRNQQEPFELPDRGRWQASAPAWIACALSILAVLWQAAVTTQRVNENTRRIERVEAEILAAQANDRIVIERLARIEAKVDVITGAAK